MPVLTLDDALVPILLAELQYGATPGLRRLYQALKPQLYAAFQHTDQSWSHSGSSLTFPHSSFNLSTDTNTSTNMSTDPHSVTNTLTDSHSLTNTNMSTNTSTSPSSIPRSAPNCDSDLDILDSVPPSPLFSLSPSPLYTSPPTSPIAKASSLVFSRKRTNEWATDDNVVSNKRLCNGGRLRDGGDGDEGDQGGPQVINWNPDCNRNGDRRRQQQGHVLPAWPMDAGAPQPNNGEEDIPFFPSLPDGEFDSHDDEEFDVDIEVQKTSVKKPRDKNQIRSKFTSWQNNGTPPAITLRARRAVVILSTIYLPDNLTKIAELVCSLHKRDCALQQLDLPATASNPWVFFQSLADRCHKLEMDVKLTDFNFMVAQIQLALYYDIICKDAIMAGKHAPGKSKVSKHLKVSYNRFRDWIEAGTRLAFLVAAGTPCILVIIAAVGLRVNLSRRHNSSNEDIYDIAFRLRNPQDDDIGKLLKTTLIPFLLKLRSLPLGHLHFPFASPLAPGEFLWCDGNDFESFDRNFLEVNTMYYPLPPRSLEWSPISLKLVDMSPVESSLIAKTVTVKYTKTFSRTSCPVTRPNRESWTRKERSMASQAVEVVDLEQLNSRLRGHAGWNGPKGGYLKIDSGICKGKTLKIQDGESNLVGILLTHMSTSIPQCNESVINILKALFPQELHEDSSKRPGYNFLSMHYSWYNRYAEK
ncbi:hypothetical protein C0993_008854, partial [Termitomyces sp. T159_Od127]